MALTMLENSQFQYYFDFFTFSTKVNGASAETIDRDI